MAVKLASMLMLMLMSVQPVQAQTPFASSSLKYFGFYDDNPPETASFTNLRLSVNATEAVAARLVGLDALLNVEDIFFNFQNHSLKQSWRESWDVHATTAAALLQNRSIIGFNLGDELVWNCLLPSAVDAAAEAVRQKFPRGQAFIWYNEATGPVSNNVQSSGCPKRTFEFTVPSALDWFSIDMYHMDGVADGWVATWPRKFYQTQVVPKLASHQELVLVPGSFGSNVNHYPNGTYVCNKSCYDTMCAHDAHDFYQWALEPASRVAAIFPWNWGGCQACNGSRWTPPHTCCMDEIGTRDQPLARAAWQQIGTTIKQSHLRQMD